MGAVTKFERMMLRRFLLAPVKDFVANLAVWGGALLVVFSGFIHLHLWESTYRFVPTLGPLFLVQCTFSFAVGVALIVWREEYVPVVAMIFMLGSIVGCVLARTVGLFGFSSHSWSSWAILALISEGAAVILFALASWLAWSKGDEVVALRDRRRVQSPDLI